jgi:hypothetical protein
MFTIKEVTKLIPQDIIEYDSYRKKFALILHQIMRKENGLCKYLILCSDGIVCEFNLWDDEKFNVLK